MNVAFCLVFILETVVIRSNAFGIGHWFRVVNSSKDENVFTPNSSWSLYSLIRSQHPISLAYRIGLSSFRSLVTNVTIMVPHHEEFTLISLYFLGGFVVVVSRSRRKACCRQDFSGDVIASFAMGHLPGRARGVTSSGLCSVKGGPFLWLWIRGDSPALKVLSPRTYIMGTQDHSRPCSEYV